jgi:hypothetical protein
MFAPKISPLGYLEKIGANPTAAKTQIQYRDILRSRDSGAGQK